MAFSLSIILTTLVLHFLVPRAHAGQSSVNKTAVYESTVIGQGSWWDQGGSEEVRLSRAEIELLRPRTMADVINRLPGLVAFSIPGQPLTLFGRGMDASRVRVIVDGWDWGDPTSIAGALDWREIPPSWVEDIRYWGSSEAIAWGSGGLAGTVMVRLRPLAERVQGEVFGGNPQVLGALIEAPIPHRTQSLALYGSRSEGTSVSARGTEPDGFSQMGGWWRSEVYDPQTRVQSQSSLRFWENHENLDSLDSNGIAVDDPSAAYSSQRLRGDWRRWKSSEMQESETAASVSRGLRRESLSQGLYIHEEGRLRSRYRYSHTELGAELRAARVSIRTNDPFGSENINRDLLEPAVFTRHLWNHRGWSLQPGLRWEGAWLAAARLEYDGKLIHPWLPVNFVHVTRGSKNPSLYQRFSAYGNQQLVPERSLSVEGGWRWQFPGTQTRILFYDHQLENLIDFDFSTNRFANRERARLQGVELSWLRSVWFVGEQSLEPSLTWTEGFAKNSLGQDLARRPRQTARSALTWRPNQQWSSTLQFDWISRRSEFDGSSLPSRSLWSTQLDWQNPHPEGLQKVALSASNVFGAEVVEARGTAGIGPQLRLHLIW